MKDENGFTVIELLVGMVIMAIVVLAASMSIGQMYKITKQNNDWSTATRQAQNAGYWLSHDAMMSVNITGDSDLTSESGNFTMEWNDWGTGNTNIINYSLIPSSNDLYQLKRTKTVIDLIGSVATTQTIIAQNIVSVQRSLAGDGWQFTTNADSRSKSVTREYAVSARVSPE